MNINFTILTVVMFFVVLVSIQFTLNKILVILKEIKEILANKNFKSDYNERTKKY